MSEATPNALDGLAADAANTPFTFPVDDETGTMRRRTFGDLIDVSHIEGDLFQIIKMVELTGDAVAIRGFRAMDEDTAIEMFGAYQRHYGYSGK